MQPEAILPPHQSQPSSITLFDQDKNLATRIFDSNHPVTSRPSLMATKFLQSWESSTVQHMFDKIEVEYTQNGRIASPSLTPAKYNSDSSIGSSCTTAPVCTAPGEEVCPQFVNANTMRETSVGQTDQPVDREADGTEVAEGHVIGKEYTKVGEDSETRAAVDSCLAVSFFTQPFAAEEQTYQGRLPIRSASTVNAKSLTPTNSASPNRTRTQINAQCVSPTTVAVSVTNCGADNEPTPSCLPVELSKLESKLEQIFVSNVEPKESLRSSELHSPSFDQGDKNFGSINKSSTSLPSTSYSVVHPHEEPNARRFVAVPDDVVCCEQPPINDVLSSPLPVSSAITPQRHAALIRLSVQRDRGLGLARRTLTASHPESPDTSDSFLSLLEINPEGEGLPEISPPEPSSYIPSVVCCAAWSYCSHARLLSTSSHKTLVDQVITTEPVIIPAQHDSNYQSAADSIPPLSLTPEPDLCNLRSDRIACNFRRRVLEEIHEDKILVSTQPSSLLEQASVVNDTLMSSSSSSRASHMLSRRRPRSTSYTYGYSRTGFDDAYGPNVDLAHESYLEYCPDRTKQRSLNDVIPLNDYDYYGKESNLTSTNLNTLPSRTYPYDIDDTLSLDLRSGTTTEKTFNEAGNRYAKFRPGEDSKRMVYPEPYTASQTLDRHRSLPSEDYEYFKEFAKAPRNTGIIRMGKHGIASRSIQRVPPRRGYQQRPYKAAGDEKRWKFRNPNYGSGIRDSTENSGSNLSDDADYIEGRSQHSLPLTYATTRRMLDLNTPGSRNSFGGSHTDNYFTLHRPSSLISARFSSQHLGGNKSLSRSTDHLNYRRASGFWGVDTSMKALRARLAAAHSESHLDRSEDYLNDSAILDRARQKYGSLDRRLESDHLITQQLRRQVEKQHRQLLRSLMDDKPSNMLWSPDFPLLCPSSSTPFSASSIPIIPNLLSENPVSPILGNIDNGPGTLISTTGAPPIFSTATSRQGMGTVYGWPITVPVSLPEAVPSAFATEFTSPVAQPSPTFLNVSGIQWPTDAQHHSSEVRTNEMQNAMMTSGLPTAQPPSTTTLLELLGNTELLQSVASDPTISSQLASLGIDLSVPQANQVTLAAVAGAVAATAIAQSGVFENSEVNGPSTVWPNLHSINGADQIDAAINDVIPVNQEQFIAENYSNTLPPYMVSDNDNQNLENLLQQLQNALATGVEQDQLAPYSDHNDQTAPEKETIDRRDTISSQNVYTNERLTTDRLIEDNFKSGATRTGPSEAVDSWLMPNSDNAEVNTSVSKFAVNTLTMLLDHNLFQVNKKTMKLSNLEIRLEPREAATSLHNTESCAQH